MDKMSFEIVASTWLKQVEEMGIYQGTDVGERKTPM